MKLQPNVCVYCGSGPGRNPAYLAAARELGRSIAEHGVGLVYGGGSNGLMGEVARSVQAHGGRVIGVIPEFLTNKERMFTEANELIVTATMHERKMTMFERADGFIVLPGGMGTLEEFSEISTWAQLDRHKKPIVLCNIEGYWQPLLLLLDHMRQEQFIRTGLELKVDVATTARAAVERFVERIQTEEPQPVPFKPVRQQM
ncbi:MAG TPA: TIGR00730 family Rossman fold protein [Aestuariivirgaceae bacterium]|jgi:uncharacterized protein (TIGR00730 family)|nr:TIGR00730 family Rossman fold protein [Nitrospira sp.]